MIVTVTLNPALDKTASVSAIKPHALNRLQNLRLDAGGKGINVSAAIHALGGRSIATGFAGGNTGMELLSMAAGKGPETDFVTIAGTTRTNLKIVDKSGGLTELNEPGPEILPKEWREMEKKLLRYGKAGNTVVLSGSLPAGLGADTYQRLAAMLRRSGAAVFVDADGDALRLALQGRPGEMPDCIKPNRHELLRCFGMRDDQNVPESELAELCRSLVCRGVGLVALSLGEAGAIFADKNGTWRSPALAVKVRSTVGAGDSMTGALAHGLEQGLPEERRFALAMAASAGACTVAGTNPPDRALVDRLLPTVRIEKTAWA